MVARMSNFDDVMNAKHAEAVAANMSAFEEAAKLNKEAKALRRKAAKRDLYDLQTRLDMTAQAQIKEAKARKLTMGAHNRVNIAVWSF